MSKRARVVVAVVVAVLLVGGIGYLAYVGAEGSRVLVERPPTEDCRTPDVQFGWKYEAINYDVADDAQLKARNPDLTDCAYQGTKAGDEIVTDDGIHIAGWYVPAANGAGPTAPTVVLVHGFKGSKSGILRTAKACTTSSTSSPSTCAMSGAAPATRRRVASSNRRTCGR